jgi:hypothetical protein
MLICVVTVPVCSAQTARTKGKQKYPTASELLGKYTTTQNKVRSFISKSETSSTGVYSWENLEKKVFTSAEVWFDGDRGAVRERTWGNVGIGGAFVQKDQAIYRSRLWDGKDYYQYDCGKKPGRLILQRDANNSGRKHKFGKAGGTHREVGTFADRICAGVFARDNDRIDVIIGQADSVSVQGKMDTIGGSKCYAISAKTKHGRYKVWIYPRHGYNVAKAIVRKQAGDLMMGRGIAKNKEALSFVLKNVRFEKIGGVWVTMEADTETKDTLSSGKFIKGKSHFKRTEFIPNPDHDALGSFLPGDIQNGARVILKGAESIKYKWQDGKVVDKDGREVDIDKLIKAESEKVKKTKQKEK